MCVYVFRSRQWHDTGSWNPYSILSSKNINYLFYIVNIMDADVLAMQGACQWQGTGIGIHQEQFHGGIFYATSSGWFGIDFSLIHFTIFLNSVVSLLSHDILGYYIQHNIICFLLLCSLMVCAKDRVQYGPLAWLVCLHITLPHYHHYADVSKSMFFLYDDCLNVCAISCYHHQIGSMTHRLGLDHETMVCALCLSPFLLFVIWPDCFMGHLCTDGFCLEPGPLSLTCSIITLLGTLFKGLITVGRQLRQQHPSDFCPAQGRERSFTDVPVWQQTARLLLP